MSFIALDLGTSFIKGAVLDLDTLHLSHIQRIPFPRPIPDLPPLLCEFDPYQIVAAVRDLIARLLPLAPDCAGIVMCGQMQGLVLTGQQGKPLSNYISWRDQRALMPHPGGEGTYFDVLSRHVEPADRRSMGNEFRPSLPLCALFWLAENKQLPGPEAIPASLLDFVIANLCNATPVIEATNACVHGALDLKTNDWNWDLIARLELEQLHWPTLRRAGTIVGYLKNGSAWLPCFTPVGDQQCALVGALLQEGELSINISTGSQVSLLCPHLDLGAYQTRPFFDGKYLNLITHIPAGRSLGALIHLLTELPQAQQIELDDPWPYIVRAVEQVNETDLRANLAFFAGACGDRGELSNISESNLTIGHIFRAAFQNMADNYYSCALRLWPERAWKRLVLSGGLSQIQVLRQLVCDKFQVESRQCPSSEDTLLGLLALSLVFSGHAPTVQQAMLELAGRQT